MFMHILYLHRAKPVVWVVAEAWVVETLAEAVDEAGAVAEVQGVERKYSF